MGPMFFYFLAIIVGLGSMAVGFVFQSRARKYAQEVLANRMSGAEIAERMLRDHGINDVKIISTPGSLTDHYNPMDKTVNLSADVYSGRSVLAAAVAAHECGHAVQHAEAYHWLEFRSRIVGPISFTSKFMPWVIMAGILLAGSLGQTLLLAGIGLFALTTVFAFVTLPVEFDASARAMAWLNGNGYLKDNESNTARTALNWAASTYVMNAVGSLATLMYYIALYMGRRN